MNILVITSKYPSNDTAYGFTPVVHYFTKEWIKQGHNVKVIHIQNKYLLIFYLLPSFIKRKLESRFGFVFPTIKMTYEKRYKLDGVLIHRILIFRLFPFGGYIRAFINKLYDKIIFSNEEDDFVPEMIISHWNFPQILIIGKLKDYYKCLSTISFHDVPNLKNPLLDEFIGILEKTDFIGFRSSRVRKEFIDNYNINRNFFYCYSGIDEKVIIMPSEKKVSKITNKFLFVGTLIKRKNVEAIIKALNLRFEYSEYYFDIVGDGPEREALMKISSGREFSNSRIRFLGRLNRLDVLNQMFLADCFIMISKDEVFGLVYLEAMAKGCLVIASRGEGMDGIIVDGYNGFLCETGNVLELARIIDKINNLSILEKENIIKNAIYTAQSLTEHKVAESYIREISF